MADRGVGEELHHHTHIIRGGVKHHWGQMHRGASQVNNYCKATRGFQLTIERRR